MDAIFAFLKSHALTPRIGAEYDLAHIREACMALDGGTVKGKIVVNVS